MSERIVVSTKYGKVRGVKRISEYSGTEYYSFYGVPYGHPPTNTLKYKDPIKAKPWKDIYDATYERPGCAQFSLKKCQFSGTEDCLFNNIHTPELPTNTTPLRAVVVLIHPGSFQHGSPNESDFGMSAFVMHRDIVYVGISYRLHILGFLNLGLKECSGNQGVKDIILSLQWMKENISRFGGDPENITLLGNSCGAGIIHTLMISPLAKGLFHKAVVLAGYVYDPIAPYKNSNEQCAFGIAESLGYKGKIDDKKKLLTFLRKLDPLLLIEAQRKHQKEKHKKSASIQPCGIFTLTLDDHAENPVLPTFPRDLMQSVSRIPLIVGFGDLETALGFCRELFETENFVNVYSVHGMIGGPIRENTMNNFKTSVRLNTWGWGNGLSDEDVELIYKQVESFYSQGKPIEKAPLSTLIDIQTGITMSDVYDTLINIVASFPQSPVYLYRFQYEGEMKTMKNSFINLFDERLEGTFHGDDVYYWGYMSDPPDDKSKVMIETYTKLISTFAKTGNPNYEDLPLHWRPTSPEAPCYLSINNELKMVDTRLHNEKLEFWDNIKKQFQNK